MFRKLFTSIMAIFTILATTFAFAQSASEAQPADVSAQAVSQEKPQPVKRHLFTFQDNSFKYSFSPSWRVPFQGVAWNNNVHTGKAYNISGHLIEFNHVDIGNKFGDNVFNSSFTIYNHLDAASPAYYHNFTTVGGYSAYFTFRHHIVLSRLFPNHKFSWGPIKDVLITTGADYATNNDAWSNRRLSPFIGPGLAFKAPNHGYINISAMWYREWNVDGTDVTSYNTTGNYPVPQTWGKRVVYDHNYTIQGAWGIPFAVGKVPFVYEGWGTFNGTKGHTAGSLLPNGQLEYQYSKPETLIHSALLYNIGRHFGEGHNWQIGVGYEYWNNEYGTDHHKVMGCLQNAPFLQFQIHL